MVAFNHTIVHAHDPDESAAFLADVLGLDPPVRGGHFRMVFLGGGASFDFAAADGPVPSNHYAFLVSEDEFDDAFARITSRGIAYYADPAGREPQAIYHHFGGRGCYFADPSGHWLEILTVPYTPEPAVP